MKSAAESTSKNRRTESVRRTRRSHRRISTVLLAVATLLIVMGVSAAWLWTKASTIKSELEAAAQLIQPLQEDISKNNPEAAASVVEQLRAHTARARSAADDPLWTLAAITPGLGSNFSAASEVARAADDVANLGLTPLVNVYRSLNWESIIPTDEVANLESLQDASPSVMAAAHAVRASAERLASIDAGRLLPQVAEPLKTAREQLQSVTGALDASADASQLIPAMMGVEGQRSYLLMIQNNAEARASGGIPGALAVLKLDNGRLTLGEQSSATAVGLMSPALPLDQEQQQIYSGRLGKFMQDVNLTPDFPTAASIAQVMWEKKSGQRVDGVISIDPVSLSYVLDATGPVQVKSPEIVALTKLGLPSELSGDNVVQTLLSDVYSKIQRPELQDVYFAGVAQEIFAALSNGKADARGLIQGIVRGTDEGRVLVWSDVATEQSVIAQYPLSGSITGPSVSPAQFGVYFNDGTGAKMDYYVKRTVQLVKECPQDGYEQTTVRITSRNTAPADAATSLPAYVTGDGNYGIPPGSVQTNIVAYGPVQANVETARLNGERTDFAPYLHGSRPVGVLAIRLAPGESSTAEFTFGKIVQHTEPNVVVTPTVQDVNDVTLPTQNAVCAPAS